MNKKVFTGLIVLMAISILGIIAVQMIWINNALKVKNELFNRSVNEALSKTAKKLEDIHNFGVVNEMAFNDTLLRNRNLKNDSIKIRVKNKSREQHRREPIKIIRSTTQNNGNTTISITVESDTLEQQSLKTYSYKMSSGRIAAANHFVMNGQNGQSEIIVVSNDTLFSDADSLYTISMVKIDSLLTRFDTLKLGQPALSKRAKVKAAELKKMASQVVSEIYMWDVSEIDTELIKKVLTEELKNKDIPIKYEFGILRDSVWVFKQGVADSTRLLNSPLKINLYPNDIFQKNLKLAILFPERNSFVYRSLNWLLAVSFLFSLFILIAFLLSVFYILKQKKISEMKSDFINNMTHEFKTPIATISVATDSIVNPKVLTDPEKITYFAGMIKKENARMNRQVEDILTIARFDKKDFEFNWEPVDVHEMISEAISGISLQAEKRGGRIDINFEAKNQTITTDKNHFSNVIFNLLDNAIKYSVDKPEISVSTKNRKDGILITVADKGIGMTKAVQMKIFERFYRQSGGNIHNVKGFGLGLSYVKAVIEANGGTITVQSETGKGSSFKLFLPFVKQ